MKMSDILNSLPKMLKADLVRECESRNLQFTGTKAELESRIREFELSRKVNEISLTENSGHEEEEEYDNQTVFEMNQQELQAAYMNAVNKPSTSRAVSMAAGPALSFRDFEDTLEPFTGNNDQNIRKWIAEFENVADMLGWEELHRYLYARRLIKGTARNFVQSLDGVNRWKCLRVALLN